MKPKPKAAARTRQPFELSDGILAFCLYLSGIPFLTTRNVYDANTLRSLGYKGETDLIEAAKECVENNKKGDLKYLFQRIPDLKRLLRVFQIQTQEIAEGTGEAKEVAAQIMKRYAAGDFDLEETMMRLACLILKLRAPFLNRWKDQEALVRVDNEGETETRKITAEFRGELRTGTETVHPGFRLLGVNASKEMRERLGL